LHAVERVGAAEYDVPERAWSAARISEQTDPPVVVVMIRERRHTARVALATILNLPICATVALDAAT
jgi:hypothetical protein